MNLKMYRGYALIIVSGFVMLAAAVLVFVNWNQDCSLHLYTKDVTGVSIGLLMLLSGACGLAMPYVAKILLRGIRLLRAGLANRKPTPPPADQGQPTAGA